MLECASDDVFFVCLFWVEKMRGSTGLWIDPLKSWVFKVGTGLTPGLKFLDPGR